MWGPNLKCLITANYKTKNTAKGSAEYIRTSPQGRWKCPFHLKCDWFLAAVAQSTAKVSDNAKLIRLHWCASKKIIDDLY